MNASVIDQVVEQLSGMPQSLQWRVLRFARTLSSSKIRGVSGQQLLQFAGATSSDELQLMQAAIQQGCEQVDPNEW